MSKPITGQWCATFDTHLDVATARFSLAQYNWSDAENVETITRAIEFFYITPMDDAVSAVPGGLWNRAGITATGEKFKDNGTAGHYDDITLSADCSTKELTIWQGERPIAFGTAAHFDCSTETRLAFNAPETPPSPMWAELKPSASASASWSAASTSTTTTTTTTTSSHTAAAYEAKYTAMATSVKLMVARYNTAVTTYNSLVVDITAAKAKFTHFQSEYTAQYTLVTRLTERLSAARTQLTTVKHSTSSYETRYANETQKLATRTATYKLLVSQNN